MEKPFVINYKEGASMLYSAVNKLNLEYDIPFYMIETILQEALFEVKVQSQAEYENACKEYEASHLNKQDNEMTLEEAAKNE